jgi:hypothetical protein
MRLTLPLTFIVAGSLLAGCGEDTTPFNFSELTGDVAARDTGSNPGLDVGTGLDAGATTDETDTTDPDPVEDTGTTPDPPTGEYDRVGFTAATNQVSSDGNNITFRGQNSDQTAVISIASYADWAGPTAPGSYALDGINYADCGLCLVISADCNGESCAKTFYADAGSVDIDVIGFGEGEQFQGVLHNVVFTEVTIDEGTFSSTPVPGGETWLVDGFEFNGFVSAAPQAGECDSATYDCIGENVSDFSFQSCETGEMVNIQEMNADVDGTWMILTAGWCSACHSWIPQVFDALDGDLAEADINLMIILGEDTNSGAPTMDYCQGYANQYGHGLSNFYIDNSGGQSYATVFENVWIYPGDGGSFGLPWNGMFKGGTGEYVYADGAGVGEVNDGINAMLQ